MEQYEKDDFLMYLIESLKEFQEYQNQCKERERKIDNYTNSFLLPYKQTTPLLASEPTSGIYETKRKTALITFNQIIRYIEELPIERIEDAKCIQLMLFEIAGARCNEKQHKKIINAVRNKKRVPSTVVNLTDNSQYVENINKQSNNYGRKRKKGH